MKPYQTLGEKEGLETRMGQGGGTGRREGDIGEARLLGQKGKGGGRENFCHLVSHFTGHHVFASLWVLHGSAPGAGGASRSD